MNTFVKCPHCSKRNPADDAGTTFDPRCRWCGWRLPRRHDKLLNQVMFFFSMLAIAGTAYIASQL